MFFIFRILGNIVHNQYYSNMNMFNNTENINFNLEEVHCIFCMINTLSVSQKMQGVNPL